MRLHMDKSSYKSAEHYLGKGRKANCNTGGTTSAQTMDDVKQSIQILSQGINIHLHLMALKMF